MEKIYLSFVLNLEWKNILFQREPYRAIHKKSSLYNFLPRKIVTVELTDFMVSNIFEKIYFRKKLMKLSLNDVNLE
jgi:hypothetical protein